MKIEFDSAEEMFEYLETMRKHFATEEKKPMTNAEKQKAYRERKKVTNGNETVTDVTNNGREKREEEREEKEAVSPLVPPSLSPDTPYPIPPIIPPSQEKEEREGERKERDSAKSPKPVRKNHHGEYQHVLLTADEFFKLLEKFGEDGGRQWIKKLDEYLENNRKKHYDNHYLTILNWARRDEEKRTGLPVQPKEETWMDVAERIQRERDAQKEVVDL